MTDNPEADALAEIAADAAPADRDPLLRAVRLLRLRLDGDRDGFEQQYRDDTAGEGGEHAMVRGALALSRFLLKVSAWPDEPTDAELSVALDGIEAIMLAGPRD